MPGSPWQHKGERSGPVREMSRSAAAVASASPRARRIRIRTGSWECSVSAEREYPVDSPRSRGSTASRRRCRSDRHDLPCRPAPPEQVELPRGPLFGHEQRAVSARSSSTFALGPGLARELEHRSRLVGRDRRQKGAAPAQPRRCMPATIASMASSPLGPATNARTGRKPRYVGVEAGPLVLRRDTADWQRSRRLTGEVARGKLGTSALAELPLAARPSIGIPDKSTRRDRGAARVRSVAMTRHRGPLQRGARARLTPEPVLDRPRASPSRPAKA